MAVIEHDLALTRARHKGMFVEVLDRFFAKYVSINSFTETVLRSPDRGEIMRWPMQLGQRPAL